MSRINVLDKHVAELIAAGEVVERPASVIKEIMENSIDAGAKKITVEIKRGGVTFMRVTDDGCGIASDDVEKAFLRHATSKVRKEEDLDSIGTLGFRGEALASISAVARVELLTKTPDSEAGTRYTISGGEPVSLDEAGCAPGTTIIIRDIFYNIPARMKFLKKDVSEGTAVAAVIDRLALSHPEIAFCFIKDGKQVLSTPGDGKLISAIYSVLGREFAAGLTEADFLQNGVKASGYICLPHNARPNRNMQHFFINGRFVKSRTAMAAMEEAYKGSIMTGKFPSCVMNIEIDPSNVDVNVHPAKTEVRFVNERPVFDAVYCAVKSALAKGDVSKRVQLRSQADTAEVYSKLTVGKPFETVYKNPGEVKHLPVPAQQVKSNVMLMPDLKTDRAENSFLEPLISIPKNAAFEPLKVSDSVVGSRTANTKYPHLAPDVKVQDNTRIPAPEAYVPDVQNAFNFLEKEKHDIKLLGEAFNTYIFAEISDNELLVIDKHAAHERIIYEKLKKENGTAFSQILLTPVILELPKTEWDAVLTNTELLCKAGYELEDFGIGKVIVRSVPSFISDGDISGAVSEIAGYLLDCKTELINEKTDWIFHNTACRAAVKAGDRLSDKELKELVIKLSDDDSIKFCPHGRPVSVIISRRELEKQFGRIQ